MLRAEWDVSADNYRLNHQTETPPPVPELLAEFWRFRRYGLPPLAGGLRDQPYHWLEHAEQLEHVYSVWQAWLRSDKGPQWRREHADVMPLIKWLRSESYG